MTTTMNNNLPGRQRRSLNDSIGHLDQMIDGLSEAIPGTIRDTLQETVGADHGGCPGGPAGNRQQPGRSAPCSTLPTVPARRAVVPHGSLLRTLLTKVCSGVATVARWSKNGVVAVATAVADCTSTVLNKLAALRQRLRSLRHAGRPLLLAFAVGCVAVIITLVAPTWVAAIVSGLGGAGVTLAVQAGLWLRQHLGNLLVTTN
jgi:hypothetical protein